jgi:hypothetical protein
MEVENTWNRVLITHNGMVQTVLVAPAVIADRMCIDHGCSRMTGWYPLTCAAGYILSLDLEEPPRGVGGVPNADLIPSYTVK